MFPVSFIWFKVRNCYYRCYRFGCSCGLKSVLFIYLQAMLMSSNCVHNFNIDPIHFHLLDKYLPSCLFVLSKCVEIFCLCPFSRDGYVIILFGKGWNEIWLPLSVHLFVFVVGLFGLIDF